jgi:hypothetical protein
MSNTLALILSILVSAIALLLGAMAYIYFRHDPDAWNGIKNAIGSAFSALFGLTVGQVRDNWLLNKLIDLFNTAKNTNFAPLLVIWLLLLILFALLGVALGCLLVSMGVIKPAAIRDITAHPPSGPRKVYRDFFTWLGQY